MPDAARPPAARRAVDLWIITGFLGSGKTSVLNSLLAAPGGRRIGVVVNDFGALGIDASLLEGADPSTVVELNGGQIFCACLSGSFVRSLTGLCDHDVDVILVESSGLAKPGPMADIIAQAVRVTAGRLRYRGMVCVVDAARVQTLRSVVNAVDEQLLHSELLLVNKRDLVDAEDLEELTRALRELCPTAAILPTEYGVLRWEELPGDAGGGPPEAGGARRGAEAAARSAGPRAQHQFAGWGAPGRPAAGTVVWDRVEQRAQVESLARRIGRVAYRVKGYVPAPEGYWYVSVSGEQVEVRSAGTTIGVSPGLTVIAPASVDIDDAVRRSWSGEAGD